MPQRSLSKQLSQRITLSANKPNLTANTALSEYSQQANRPLSAAPSAQPPQRKGILSEKPFSASRHSQRAGNEQEQAFSLNEQAFSTNRHSQRADILSEQAFSANRPLSEQERTLSPASNFSSEQLFQRATFPAGNRSPRSTFPSNQHFQQVVPSKSWSLRELFPETVVP